MTLQLQIFKHDDDDDDVKCVFTPIAEQYMANLASLTLKEDKKE
jgi:hypothetical protein